MDKCYWYISILQYTWHDKYDHILKQEITIPHNAAYLKWNISPTVYGTDPDQYNASVSIKFNGEYVLMRIYKFNQVRHIMDI